jgi:hypothetical protein
LKDAIYHMVCRATVLVPNETAQAVRAPAP